MTRKGIRKWSERNPVPALICPPRIAWGSVASSQWAEEYPTCNKKRKANWIGHILRRNCLLKQVIEGKIKEEIEVTRRQGRRRKKSLDDLKDRRGYSHLKEEALDRNMRRDRFGRCFEPVVRQTTGWWRCVAHGTNTRLSDTSLHVEWGDITFRVLDLFMFSSYWFSPNLQKYYCTLFWTLFLMNILFFEVFWQYFETLLL